MIPSLSELLTEQTTILLGAGASFDYGFPLWSQLKNDLLNALENIEEYGLERDNGIEWWIKALNEMKEDDTIDKLATYAPEEHYDLFRKLMGIVISNYEKKDIEKENTGWIENFSEKFCQLLKSKYPNKDEIESIISNLNIITLNYDRVFNVRFSSIVINCFKNVLTKPREYEKFYQKIFNGILEIYHPHGCLGSGDDLGQPIYNTYMNPSSGLKINYGDTDTVKRMISRDQIPFIFPVDDLEGGENDSYKKVNQILQNTSNVLCIGLSPLGITASQLDLSKTRNVYYSGKEKILENFIPLARYANQIIEELQI